MTDNNGRKIYGVTELAERLRRTPAHVRVLLSRSLKSGIWGEVPPPDEYVSNRPVWFAETVDAHLEAKR